MTKVYACLIGNWVCLNDDPDSKVGDYGQSPTLWWKEGAPLYAPNSRDPETEHQFYELDYINIYYQHRKYRINPSFIQIVSE